MKKVKIETEAESLLNKGKKLVADTFGKVVDEDSEQRMIPPIDLDFIEETPRKEPTQLLGGYEDYAYLGMP